MVYIYARSRRGRWDFTRLCTGYKQTNQSISERTRGRSCLHSRIYFGCLIRNDSGVLMARACSRGCMLWREISKIRKSVEPPIYIICVHTKSYYTHAAHYYMLSERTAIYKCCACSLIKRSSGRSCLRLSHSLFLSLSLFSLLINSHAAYVYVSFSRSNDKFNNNESTRTTEETMSNAVMQLQYK